MVGLRNFAKNYIAIILSYMKSDMTLSHFISYENVAYCCCWRQQRLRSGSLLL